MNLTLNICSLCVITEVYTYYIIGQTSWRANVQFQNIKNILNIINLGRVVGNVKANVKKTRIDGFFGSSFMMGSDSWYTQRSRIPGIKKRLTLHWFFISLRFHWVIQMQDNGVAVEFNTIIAERVRVYKLLLNENAIIIKLRFFSFCPKDYCIRITAFKFCCHEIF